MRRTWLALPASLFVAAACGGSAPPPAQPGPGPAPVNVESAPPGSSAPSPSVATSPAETRACCTPSGAYDPSDTSYNDCVARGGRPWGSDGCGVKADGTIQAPPPSMAPQEP